MRTAMRRWLAAGTVALAVLGLAVPDLWAQDTEVAERGLQVTGSYRLGDIETVNTKNGNVMLRVPLASLPPGRGGDPGFQLTLNYNSKLWDIYVEHVEDPSDSTNPIPGNDPNPANALSYRVKQTLKQALGNPGWSYNYQYMIDLDKRSLHRIGLSSVCDPNNTNQTTADPNQLLYYEYKVNMVFPDGSVHVFLPEGEATNTYNHDHYFPVRPDGRRLSSPCGQRLEGPAQGTQTVSYYSVDGTYLRLEFEVARDDDRDGTLDPETWWPNNNWTLYFPNGRRVRGTGLMSTEVIERRMIERELIDPNENTTTIRIDRVLTPGGTPQDEIIDSVGRKIIIKKDGANGKHYISQTGAGGAQMQWTVDWGNTTVSRDYSTGVQNEALSVVLDVVNQITLPRQLGALTYRFAYNGGGSPSTGLGEMSQVTVPGGSRASYSYSRDILPGASGRLSDAGYAQDNRITRKDFVYNVAGQANAVTERWTYGSGTVTAPDGGVTLEFYSNEGWLTKVEQLEGSQVVRRVERIWATNPPRGLDTISARRANPYVKTEFTTLVGSSTKTAIKDFTYDKNGNVLRVKEYDWVSEVPRDDAGRPTGIPDEISPQKVTVHTYHAETPEASVTTADNDAYHLATSPRLKRARKSTEIHGGSGTRLSRREFTYGTDNAYARTTGNLTEETIWDSKRGAVSNPLTSTNSITISHRYDSHGNRISTTDGKGNVTRWMYGGIATGGGSSKSGLYPTQVVEASETTVSRTMSYVYDFHTGGVTSATDSDNNVTTLTDLDAVGRPTVVTEASGRTEERQTRTWYCDSRRRMIVRSDLSGRAGSGELVTVADYDQTGRVSQTRTWESGAPPMPGEGADRNAHCAAYPSDSDSDRKVIKVKTHDQYVNTGSAPGHYTWTSNPYRQTGDATMGWTRTRADQLGRAVEVGLFGGTTKPSTSATPTLGKTTTVYDAEFTTVTDAANNKRRSRLDGLGRLVRVDEPNSTGNLGLTGSPVQKTDYCYDGLGNLTRVIQGSPLIQGSLDSQRRRVNLCTGVIQNAQTRTFAYDSLYRLTQSRNPESGTINYTYDKNGNLKTRTDARNVRVSYEYDDLDRLTRRSYSYTGSDTAVSLGTTQVDYDYDNCGGTPDYSEGRLCSVIAKKGTTVSSKTAYANYDALGRVGKSTQTTGGQAYTMAYAYDRAGNLISQTYPSGKVVETVYDGAGRVAGVRKKKADRTYDYYAGGVGVANAIGYAAHGGIERMRLGNVLWEERRYNRRLQPTQIGLGTARTTAATLDTATSPRLLLDYSYGTTTNNGSVASQQIRVGTLDLTQSYAYDKLNRLTGATERRSGTETWSQTYQYDVYGNRAVTAGRNHGSHQALTPSALTSFNASTNRLLGGAAYDGAGNLTLDWGGRRFKYDGDNRMVSFDTAGVNTDGTYHYDGEGRRVKRVVGGVTTTYVYNVSGQLVAEYATSGTPLAGIRYLTTDHLGSTRVVTQAVVSGPDGGVVSRHDYLPFGEEIGSLGGRTAALKYSASGPAQKFTGKERDNESGLDYFGARYFSGAEGRFTSVDPENASGDPADPQSWNGYAYARNNPLLYVDPDGRYFVVCQSDGDCTTYAVDSEFYRFLREEKLQFDPETDEDGNLLPTNIYSVDERGNKTLYGQAFHSRHAPGLGDEGVGPLELALGTGLTSLARKAVRNLFRGKGTARSSTATDLGSLGRSGSSKKIREVVGDSGDALKLFDKLRGNNPVREIKPGIFVAKGKTGGHVTFRPSSKSGPPTVDVHGLEPGGRKIKFVPE